jgi:hypothetical protein
MEDVKSLYPYNLKEYYHQNVIDLYSNSTISIKHTILVDLLNDLTKKLFLFGRYREFISF